MEVDAAQPTPESVAGVRAGDGKRERKPREQFVAGHTARPSKAAAPEATSEDAGGKRKSGAGGTSHKKRKFERKANLPAAYEQAFWELWPACERAGWRREQSMDVASGREVNCFMPPGVSRGGAFRSRTHYFDSVKQTLRVIGERNVEIRTRMKEREDEIDLERARDLHERTREFATLGSRPGSRAKAGMGRDCCAGSIRQSTRALATASR